MAELREATTKPCTKQHLFQVGEYQMQDTQLLEPFEVNVAFMPRQHFSQFLVGFAPDFLQLVSKCLPLCADNARPQGGDLLLFTPSQ